MINITTNNYLNDSDLVSADSGKLSREENEGKESGVSSLV